MSDAELIIKARSLDDEDWQGAFRLAEKAQSPEAKETIEQIARHYYHNEEFRSGNY